MTRHAYAAGVAFGQHLDAGSFQFGTPVFGITRHWHRKGIRKAAQKPAITVVQLVRVHPKQLVTAMMFRNTVEMIEQCLRAPANSKSPKTITPRPFHDLRQLLPIGNIFKRQLLDGGTGHDQRVKKVITHIIKATIIAPKIAGLGVTRRIAGCCHQDHLGLQRRVTKQARKLDFGILLLWHQIQQ